MIFRLRNQGGLGLPNLWWYYKAAQLAQISTVYSKGPKPDWVSIERQAVPCHMIDYLNWSLPKLRSPILVPTLSHSLVLCDTLHKQATLVSNIRPLSHLIHNPGLSTRDEHSCLPMVAKQSII